MLFPVLSRIRLHQGWIPVVVCGTCTTWQCGHTRCMRQPKPFLSTLFPLSYCVPSFSFQHLPLLSPFLLTAPSTVSKFSTQRCDQLPWKLRSPTPCWWGVRSLQQSLLDSVARQQVTWRSLATTLLQEPANPLNLSHSPPPLPPFFLHPPLMDLTQYLTPSTFYVSLLLLAKTDFSPLNPKTHWQL